MSERRFPKGMRVRITHDTVRGQRIPLRALGYVLDHLEGDNLVRVQGTGAIWRLPDSVLGEIPEGRPAPPEQIEASARRVIEAWEAGKSEAEWFGAMGDLKEALGFDRTRRLDAQTS